MENKINIAELLKDCPKGTKLYSPLCGECRVIKVYNYLGFDVINGTDDVFNFSYDGRYNLMGECCIFPSKDQRDWSKFEPPCEFKDGDIVATTNGLFVGIVKVKNNKPVGAYCSIDYVKDFRINNDYVFDRLATEEEKAKLFDVIKANGYKWNPETKTLEKLIEPKFKVGDRIRLKENHTYTYTITGIREKENKYECGVTFVLRFSEHDNWELVPNKFDITALKPFDKVLARNDNSCVWKCNWYSHYSKYPYHYICTDTGYKQCIPYEGNQHLRGTTDDCDEYYKNW